MSTAQAGYIFGRKSQGSATLAETLAALRLANWLPEEQSWWFAWHELEIMLPQRLGDLAALPADWDELRVFSAQVELRQVRQGRSWRCSLLTETADLPSALVGWAMFGVAYRAVSGTRVLWGRRLRISGGEKRGEVLFPRPLEYDVAGETTSYDQALVADVWAYYDSEARLQTVRYAGLKHLQPGADIAMVQALPCFWPEGDFHDVTT